MLSLPILEAAVRTLNEMATFSEAEIARPRALESSESSATWESVFA
jgi:hypothetical protein